MPQAKARDTVRVEHDLLGDRDIPVNAYWGVHTLRAVENFPITGNPISVWPEFIRALALVKQAAAQTNYELGLLEMRQGQADHRGLQGNRQWALHEQFVVDVIQGGAGTSTNMNANEVIANRRAGNRRQEQGRLQVPAPDRARQHGAEHERRLPDGAEARAALRHRGLWDAMGELRVSFAAKSTEFRDILKIGRTQLQDAVPMTLGQEFSTFAVMLGEDQQRLLEAGALIEEINLGATAIGTGINSHPGYAPLVCKHLVQLSGVQVRPPRTWWRPRRTAGRSSSFPVC